MQYLQKQQAVDNEWRLNAAKINELGSESRYHDEQTKLGAANLTLEWWKAQAQIAYANGQPAPPMPTQDGEYVTPVPVTTAPAPSCGQAAGPGPRWPGCPTPHRRPLTALKPPAPPAPLSRHG